METLLNTETGVREGAGRSPVTRTNTNHEDLDDPIKRQLDREFDRVTASLRSIAARQQRHRHADTVAIIALLEEKRAEVMREQPLRWGIHDRRSFGDQIREWVLADARYQAITAYKPAPERRAWWGGSLNPPKQHHGMSVCGSSNCEFSRVGNRAGVCPPRSHPSQGRGVSSPGSVASPRRRVRQRPAECVLPDASKPGLATLTLA